VVMGNADAWLLSGQETGNEQIPAERLRKMHAVRDWSLWLTAGDRAFIGQFRPTWRSNQVRSAAALFSWLAVIVRRHLLPLPRRGVSASSRRLCLFYPDRRTHPLQQVRRIGDSFFQSGECRVGLHQQADDNFQADPWAEYAVLTLGSTSLGLEFRRSLRHGSSRRAYREWPTLCG
jgi:hypothetical protein